jgi:YegS/Rv2252/BmrU family lipid kinase
LPLLGERALLIANPGARQGQWLLEPARDAFHKAGVQVDVVVTEARGHGARVARELVDDYDLIFTLGGDGTAMEVVHALMGTNRSVGILAGGTGNLIARVLQIPLDVRRAVPALLHGSVVRIDLGILGDGRSFAITAGTGVDAEMIAAAPLELRRRFGILTYFATASQSVLAMKPFDVRASVDGRIIEREQCMGAMIVNMGSVLDGMFELGPGISHQDGALDLCVFCARNVADAAILAGRIALKDFSEGRHMTFARGRSITLEAAPSRECQADGELIGPTPLVARVEPLAAPLLVPRRDG